MPAGAAAFAVHGGSQPTAIQQFFQSWKEQQERVVTDMQRNYSHEHSLFVKDYQKLDRDFQEALQEKIGLEEEFRQMERNYVVL